MTTTVEVLARHLDVGDKVEVDLGGGNVTLREVLDVALLNYARDMLVMFDVPEAPGGKLSVVLQGNMVLKVNPGDPRRNVAVQYGNLREYLAIHGRRR